MAHRHYTHLMTWFPSVYLILLDRAHALYHVWGGTVVPTADSDVPPTTLSRAMDPEVGGSIFLRNSSEIVPNYTASQARRRNCS
jgi:hypothetical protein